MDIIFREATYEDAVGISYVSAQSWLESYSEIIDINYLKERVDKYVERSERTKKYLDKINGKYFVAIHDGKVVGIMTAEKQSDETYKDYGEIGAIYVLKDYQGLGIGKNLFKIGFETLKSFGYKKAKLECLEGNKTINFYKKYLGKIDKTFDYTIKDVGSYKAEIVLFESIDDLLNLMNK